jgi:hypothetical protein
MPRTLDDVDNMNDDDLAPLLHACIQRLGQLGRSAATALAAQVDDDDDDFHEGAGWIEEIAGRDFKA